MEGNGEIIETLDGSMFANLAEGETITLSLEEASQLLLDGGQFAPGTYQIVTTSTPNINNQELVHVPYELHHDNSTATNQTTMVSLLSSNIQHLTPAGDLQIKTPHTGESQLIPSQNVDQEVEDEVPIEGVSEENFIPDSSQGLVKIENVPDVKFDNQVPELNQVEDKFENSATQEAGDSNSQFQIENPDSQPTENGNPNFENVNTSNSNEITDIDTTLDVPNENDQSSTLDENSKESEKSSVKEIKVKKEPKPDLDCPISVSDRTEVVINGKKCVLLVNPDTKEMCAYPLLPPDGKRRRGRPKKPPRTAEEIEIEREEKKKAAQSQEQEGDQNSSAVQGLLELSNMDPDSVRRSGRARKKTKTLEEYENLELSDVEDIEDAGAIDDDEEDEDVVLPGYKRRKIDSTFQSVILAPTSEKRPRGRPRRYPPAGQVSTSSIPAVLIPSSNGQTLMMAPLQGVQNLESLQNQVKSINTQLLPMAMTTDGRLSIDSTIQSLLPVDGTQSNQDLPDAPTSSIDPSSASVLEGTILNNLETDSLNLNTSDSTLHLEVEGEDNEEKPTIIQIPENLLPMFVPKKDPVRIGLKASESELEKLKCPKCDFQGYYSQQYQNHISTTHSDHISKCKCCNFYTFDRDELLEHFKEMHPKCICTVCEFMAEHSYVIKRHMVRHNKFSCMCNVCGKAYKDQYILKMHVKMVHMPAEVLFECNICYKKFTRKAHLKRHLRIHDPEKPFKCPHCEYRGCERSDISKHLLIHEEPKHVCGICNKAFRHLKNKDLHVKRHNGQKDYKCGVCGFYGYTFTDIRKHIERKHGDMKSLVCDKCGMAFKAEIMLREHQRVGCEGVIEQALSISTSDGGTSQAMIQIPSTLSVDGQSIMIDGQEISVDEDGAVNITFEQVLDGEDEDIHLLENQIAASSGQMSEGEGQISVGQGQILVDQGQIVSESHITVPNGQFVSIADVASSGQGHNIVIQGEEVNEGQEIELDLDNQTTVDELMGNS